MKGRIGTSGQTYTLGGTGLQRVASGWVDEEIVTVRKMAAAGATAEEIGAAIGKSKISAVNIIRRNKLIWNHKSEERHLLSSAQAIGAHMRKNACAWHEKALELRRAGVSLREIAATLGVSMTPVQRLCRKHGLGSVSLTNDKRSGRPASKSEEAA